MIWGDRWPLLVLLILLIIVYHHHSLFIHVITIIFLSLDIYIYQDAKHLVTRCLASWYLASWLEQSTKDTGQMWTVLNTPCKKFLQNCQMFFPLVFKFYIFLHTYILYIHVHDIAGLKYNISTLFNYKYQ